MLFSCRREGVGCCCDYPVSIVGAKSHHFGHKSTKCGESEQSLLEHRLNMKSLEKWKLQVGLVGGALVSTGKGWRLGLGTDLVG